MDPPTAPRDSTPRRRRCSDRASPPARSPPGDEGLLCIELIIPEDTPASASGQTIAFTLTLRGDQIGATP